MELGSGKWVSYECQIFHEIIIKCTEKKFVSENENCSLKLDTNIPIPNFTLS